MPREPKQSVQPSQGFLERWFGGGELPYIPPPTPTRLTTGLGPVMDRATELMPPDQKRRLQILIEQKRVGLDPTLPWGTGKPQISFAGGPPKVSYPNAKFQYGAYSPTSGRMSINPEMLLRDELANAKNLTHESTHALQPSGFIDRMLKRTREPLTNVQTTGNAYLDDPREQEARSVVNSFFRRK